MTRVADPETGNELAQYEALRLAFAPLVFQGCRALRDSGVLSELRRAGASGLTAKVAAERANTSLYAAALLLEAGLAGGLAACDLVSPDPRFTITKAGVFWLRDPMTQVHAEFTHHVCYAGAFQLGEALRTGLPLGLPTLAPKSDGPPWRTVYEALGSLPNDVRKAWFDFDHFHSDGVFELCIDRVLELARGRDLVELGGNTGKFARLVLGRGGVGSYTLVDLPGQIATAREELGVVADGLRFSPTDLLDPSSALPPGDVFWMSQFLDCFSEAQIVSILARVRAALRPSGRAFILETFWDQQRHEAARHCVIGTSLYFACIANGDSRMYHSAVFGRLIEEAGLVVLDVDHRVGISHSLLTLGRAEDEARA